MYPECMVSGRPTSCRLIVKNTNKDESPLVHWFIHAYFVQPPLYLMISLPAASSMYKIISLIIRYYSTCSLDSYLFNPDGISYNKENEMDIVLSLSTFEASLVLQTD